MKQHNMPRPSVIYLLGGLLFCLHLQAQIKGKISDATNKQPIPGASIVAGKFGQSRNQHCHWLNTGVIDITICSNEVPWGRPHPFMIHAIMDRLQTTDPAANIKVGDTQVDVEKGRDAGCGLVVSVTTGAYTIQQLEKYKPDHIIDPLDELTAITFTN